jgi:hypothetical protein
LIGLPIAQMEAALGFARAAAADPAGRTRVPRFRSGEGLRRALLALRLVVSAFAAVRRADRSAAAERDS